MRIRKSGICRGRVVATHLATLLFASLWPIGLSGQRDTTGIHLGPGVLVDRSVGIAYVMKPDSSISAVGLANGATAWSTKRAAFPLALNGNLLVAQVQPSAATQNSLQIVAIDTRNRGTLVLASSAALPRGVRASIGQTTRSSFIGTAASRASDVYVWWVYTSFPRRGDLPPDSASLAVTERTLRPSGVPTITRGVFRMTLPSATLAPLATASVTATPPVQMLRRLSGDERLVGAAEAQFLSEDGRHVVSRERLGDERLWEKYRWTVYERSTMQRLGAIRTHISIAPFIVNRSAIIFTTSPYVRRGERPQPRMLRAFDLSSGRELWSSALREIEYRGPLPP